ncbi:MAG: tRNA (adenine-N1)-methyltransferase [Acidimicrobiia bacterium]|nr:tRNA (adenine-N1)-methyltransferase [Acidimicrobiia bacterium]
MTRPGRSFQDGEPCLVYDKRGRTHLLSLSKGSTFHSDQGTLPHDAIIGSEEGITLRSSGDAPLVVMRPRLADYVLKMKRGAAVLYPKDAGAIVTWADIQPGDLVLEAGTGSGALTLALARAVGPTGRVVTVERRADHLTHARRVIEGFHGAVPDTIEFRTAAVEDVVSTLTPDRVILDLPEPWTVVPGAADALKGGGTFACYLPTVPQVQQVRDAMGEAKAFVEVDTFEILMRSWTVEGRSVRPDHRMVGHTGFITVGRKRLPKASFPPGSGA